MKLMYVYILECSDNSFYTGVTNNIDKRINEHNEGNDPKSYTYSRRPLILVFQQCFTDPNEAIAFEKKIKGWSHKKKQALIDGNWNEIKKLAKSKNQYVSKTLSSH